jgi:pantoate--beta-alanine ligase
VAVPTVREPDGLAMSSRNTYLSPEERRAATVLWRSLCRARELFDGGERRAEVIREGMRAVLASEPLARVEYVSVADGETLAELETVDRPAMVSLAVRIGRTRLIDNVTVG